MIIYILLGLSLASCAVSLGDVPFPVERPIFAKLTDNVYGPTSKINTAAQFIDYNEHTNRAELREFIGVDPVRTEWCAAFVNAVLRDSGIDGSGSVSKHPLTARSFLHWGEEVKEPRTGDIVVFPRGNVSWQGHVGFYFGEVMIGSVKYYRILGGNQNNKVSIELYPAHRALSIRRESSV